MFCSFFCNPQSIESTFSKDDELIINTSLFSDIREYMVDNPCSSSSGSVENSEFSSSGALQHATETASSSAKSFESVNECAGSNQLNSYFIR